MRVDLARKRCVIVHAMKLTRWSLKDAQQWIDESGGESRLVIEDSVYYLEMKTPEGWSRGKVGDSWVIQGAAGEFYPIKESIFKETYDVVGEVEDGGPG